MKKRWQSKERTRLLLTLELAVTLPAALLIVANVWHLKSIQRDRAVEAAIQRDFYQVLAISDKHMSEKAGQMVERLRQDFPSKQTACTDAFDTLLARYPYAAHMFIYSPDRGFVFRSRQARMGEADFRTESDELSKILEGWFKLEFSGLVKKLQKLEAQGKPPIFYDGNSVPRGEKHGYSSLAIFLLPVQPGQESVLGGVAFDAEYLRDEFFPAMLSETISHNAGEGGPNRTAIMVHMKGDSTPLAASADWDGAPEVEHSFESAFPGLILGMKLQGTTVAAIGKHFMRMSFLILGGLSVVLAGGILLTYRNVTREMALARLKSDFVSNVSHELRTPLSLIRLYAETLELGRLSSSEKHHEYYCIIRKESERLTALINNILDFSRIEAGRKEYEFRETDIAELVRNTLESYRYQIEQHGFTFRENIADNLPPIPVDREAIARSLLNLVNNALKYSQEEKFLSVNLYRENGSVKLEVVDHGIGIPRTEQHKIFEKFYRVGDPLVHNTKGSGLGLSLVRHIVQAHGGDISVESSPGQGSKFIIALPLYGEASDAKGASA